VRSITELEGYAVSKRVTPSVELGTAIERLLTEGALDAEPPRSADRECG
jgi:hypothetical protein